MDNDTVLLFDLPSVSRKKVSAAFDGGRITSDGGVALLALAAKVEHIADPIRVQRAETASAAVRGFAETRHGAKSWKCERRVVARIEATPILVRDIAAILRPAPA